MVPRRFVAIGATAEGIVSHAVRLAMNGSRV
jgi:hypothetical protein